jgi:hypothetical protein
MRKTVFTSVILCLCLCSAGQSPTYLWAKGYAGTSQGNCVVTDDSSRVYLATQSGITNIDCSFGKYEKNGNMIWGKTFNGSGDEIAKRMFVDSAHNVYVCGSISSNGFFAKYSAGGNLVWSKDIGTASNSVQDIAVSSSGDVYITGYFTNTCDFDPGAGTQNLTAAGSGWEDIFVGKYDSSGNYVWAKKFGGAGTYHDRGNRIVVDGSGNCYFSGYFSKAVDFGNGFPIGSATNNYYEGFLCKYTSAGNYSWAVNFTSSTGNVCYQSSALAIDVNGKIDMTGDFIGTANFDPLNSGTSMTSASSTMDVFVTRYNSTNGFVTGGLFKLGSSSFADYGSDISADASGDFYVTGVYGGTVDFDAGAGTANKSSNSSSQDIFVVKYDNSFSYKWVMSFGNSGSDYGYSVAESNSFVYITGRFSGNVYFDLVNSVYLTSSGNNSAFLGQYGNCYGGSVPAQPAAIAGLDTVCYASNTTFSTNSVSGALYYNWTLPSGWSGHSIDTDTSIYVLSPNNASNNTVKVTANNLCGVSTLRSKSVFVKGGAYLGGSMTGSTTVCQGTSTSYSVSPSAGAINYVWTLPSGWTGTSSTNSITVVPGATSGTVSVIAYNNCGPSSAIDLSVTVNPLPAVPTAISGPSVLCTGSASTYSITAVGGATSYTWSFPSGWTGASTTTSVSATASSTSGDVSVTANNSCGSSAAQTLSVTTSAPAQPTGIIGSASVCEVSSNTYSVSPVSGASSYTWTLPSGWTGSSTTNSITSTSNSTSGNISVIATNTCGSSASQTLALNVNLKPTVTTSVSPSASACKTTQVTLSGSGGQTYSWSGGITDGTPFTVNSTATYTVTGTDANGCTNTSTITITALSLPTATVSGGGIICTGSSVSSASVSIALTGTGPWNLNYSDGTNSNVITGINSSPYIISSAGLGMYSVTSVSDANCSGTGTGTASVVTVAPPTIQVSSTDAQCSFDGGTATASASGNGPFTYIWNNGDNTATADTLAGGQYQVTVIDNNGCSANSPVIINSSNGPAVSNGVLTDVTCNGGSNGSISVNVAGGATPYSYNWTTGGNTSSISNLAEGTYILTVTDANNCNAVKSFAVNAPQPLQINFSSVTSNCSASDGSLTANISGGTSPYTFQWDANAASQTSATATNLSAGNYSVTVTDNVGCTTASNTVLVTTSSSIIFTTDSIVNSSCTIPGGAIYVTTSGDSISSYLWSNGATSQDATNLIPGTYTVIATDTAGCTSSLTATIQNVDGNYQPQICIVTVDTVSASNTIVWETVANQSIASYNVYCEVGSFNNYQLAGNVPATSAGTFVHAGANPAVQSWKYKISAIDSCGNETALSDYHTTLHLQSNLGSGGTINLNWNNYYGISYSGFKLLRYDISTGWQQIATIPYCGFQFCQNTYTDLAPPSLDAKYLVEIDLASPCVSSTTFTSTNSNERHLSPNIISSLSEAKINSANSILVYPNPCSDKLIIATGNNTKENRVIRIYDCMGKEIKVGALSKTETGKSETVIDIHGLPNGVYSVQVKTAEVIATKKIIVAR